MGRKEDDGPTAEYFDRLRELELKVILTDAKQSEHEKICALRYEAINHTLGVMQYWGPRLVGVLVLVELLGGSGAFKVIAKGLGIPLPN